MHEDPKVLHMDNPVRTAIAKGMVLTIEPMINEGPTLQIDDNQWTARTVTDPCR